MLKVSLQSVREIIGVVGAAMAGVGAWMHYPPLGLIVAGFSLVLVAVVGTLRAGRR